MAYFRQRFIERAVLSLDPLSIWGFAWTVMVLHDAWFFWVHTVMHNSKPLYKEFHQLHHGSTSDLNAFGTSFAGEFDPSCKNNVIFLIVGYSYYYGKETLVTGLLMTTINAYHVADESASDYCNHAHLSCPMQRQRNSSLTGPASTASC